MVDPGKTPIDHRPSFRSTIRSGREPCFSDKISSGRGAKGSSVGGKEQAILRYFLVGSSLFVLWLIYGFNAVFYDPGLIAPNLWVGMISLAGSFCVFLPLFWLKRKRTTKDILLAIAVFGLFMGGVSCVRDLPESRLKQSYSAIRIGMTQAEVEAILRREFPQELPPFHGNETGGYIGPPPDGPNAEFIGVSMTNGRVTSKIYLPD